MRTQLTNDTHWISECHKTDGAHEHVNVYLIEEDDDYLLIDSGSFHDRETIKRKIESETDGQGLDAIILSHSDYPHSGNVSEFRSEWDDVTLIASCGSPRLQGISNAIRCQIGKSMEIIGREFSFIDPPLADRSHTTWIYDHGDNVLYTADGFGNYHGPGECKYTSRDFPRGITAESVYEYHRDSLVWLRYVDPKRLEAAINTIFSEYKVDWVAPVHGNPIAGEDLSAYIADLIDGASRISAEYESRRPDQMQ
ncbi:MBL fold metallo-hydrolase [Halostagnicola sp. A-GB9-2]|uniref:MBL fold metallo-hydrolase n=1 Tax=Halostagnicola sp. A-GB9-2 TaxID=3048066 RepID=UPI0024BFE36C|nr:MBL fold metallo-hydrolase [Halostagnicola sp. A-GB9-2]MDJ1434282.1 MBL fold metallo-hydrolase [Halostagnicola sp. A-GB9-2]